MRAYLLLEVFLAKNALDSSEREAQDAQRASVAVEKKIPRVEKGGPKALARGVADQAALGSSCFGKGWFAVTSMLLSLFSSSISTRHGLV